jgi:hypothetical protein
MKYFIFIILLGFSFSSFTQKSSDQLAGIWTCPFDGGYTMKLELKPDGTGRLDDAPITYRSSGGKLTIMEDANTSTTYSYSLSGNKLVLSGGDLSAALSFSRGSGTTTAPKVATQKEPPSDKSSKMEKPSGLVGTWTGPTGTLAFQETGKGTANGQPFTWSVSGDQLTTTDPTGTFVFSYVVQANDLAITGYGQTSNFKKGKANSQAEKSANTNQSNTGKGQELVGKWCYLTSNYNSLYSTKNSSFTNECFMLNADGTYSYQYEANRSASNGGNYGYSNSTDSDQGTWSFDGVDKVTVVSQKGTSTYTIEKKNHPKTGDPMIFVNGRGYVTFYNKKPW